MKSIESRFKRRITMIRFDPKAILGLLSILILVPAAEVVAQGFPYQPPPGQQLDPRQGYGPWQFRPMEPSNARGVAPAPPQQSQAMSPQGWQPQQTPQGQYPYGSPQYPTAPGQYGPPQQGRAQYPSYGRQPAGGASEPRLEIAITENQPYVQQDVLVRLRVISNDNLATATPELSGIEDALFEQLSGPTLRTRGSGGDRQIVNEFILAMTPLRDGTLSIGPFKVDGKHADGRRYEATAEPRTIQVRPAMATVRPWLPLESLTLNATLDSDERIVEGRPVTLMVELKADGATGERLPSLEGMLRSEDFRLYREQTLTDTELSRDGRHMQGRRTEYYTLVPHSGGRLQLPEVRLDWWDTQNNSRKTSSLPIQTFRVEGESGIFGLSRSAGRAASEGLGGYWLPVAGIALLLLGYWGGVWLRERLPKSDGGPLGPRLRGMVVGASATTGRGLRTIARQLDPTPLLRWSKTKIERAMPAGSRIYRCVRIADQADTPAAWCVAFQHQACRHLEAEIREPLPRVADRIVRLRPGADQEQVISLMSQLDRALYGREKIDFPRWKHDFRRALRPGTGWLRGLLASRVHRQRLPELNPRPA